MSNSGKLQKLMIVSYANADGQSSKCSSFTALINPASYKRQLTIKYNDAKGGGSAGGSPSFERINSETISFELVFDATGAAPSAPGAEEGIKPSIEKFLKTVAKYDGSIHSPDFLVISWGSLNIECRLQSLDLNYTLFKPDGVPLRARANASFISFTEAKLLQAKQRDSSPDLTHVVTVMAGDSLPTLCHRIYGDASLYARVAEFNGLTSLRRIEPGTRLSFPPLTQAA